jgi:hypothetical protein
MVGDKVTVYLNGELVTDNVVLENYWTAPSRSPEGADRAADHGNTLYFKNISSANCRAAGTDAK